MSTKDMPAWPDAHLFVGMPGETIGDIACRYERARADAAMERLRVAVEALESLQYLRCTTVDNALAAIGPLPCRDPASSDES